MYIALCDDHAQELKQIAGIMEAYASERRIHVRVRCFTDAEDMLLAAREERFTHYFLDIIMPCMDGIAAARQIRSFDEEAKLVFLTASNEYSYQSYRVRAADYLLKPIESAQLYELLDRLQAEHARTEAGICVQSGRSLFRIPYARLSHLEINQKKLYFHMADGQIRKIPGTMAEYEDELLSRPEFIRIHRSYIVNLDQISVLEPDGCITLSGKNLPVSRLLYKHVRAQYMQRLFGEAEV